MKIQPQYLSASNPYNKNQQTFGTNLHCTRNLLGMQTSTNISYFVRPTSDWKPILNHTIEKFKNAEHVNMYYYALSDGSDLYTYLFGLYSKLGKEGIKKFLPVKGKDIDPYYFENIKKGTVNLWEDDITRIEELTKMPVSTFLDINPVKKNVDGDLVYEAKVKDFFRDSIILEKANILEDLDNINPDNSILLFKNAWGYLNRKERNNLVHKLGQKLSTSSMLVMDAWDRSYLSLRKLEKNGFGLSPVSFCYDKLTPALEQSSIQKNKHLSNPHYLFNIFAKKHNVS